MRCFASTLILEVFPIKGNIIVPLMITFCIVFSFIMVRFREHLRVVLPVQSSELRDQGTDLV